MKKCWLVTRDPEKVAYHNLSTTGAPIVPYINYTTSGLTCHCAQAALTQVAGRNSVKKNGELGRFLTNSSCVVFRSGLTVLPARELTYPTLGKGK